MLVSGILCKEVPGFILRGQIQKTKWDALKLIQNWAAGYFTYLLDSINLKKTPNLICRVPNTI